MRRCAAVICRATIAATIVLRVEEEEWGAAMALPAGILWCVEREDVPPAFLPLAAARFSESLDKGRAAASSCAALLGEAVDQAPNSGFLRKRLGLASGDCSPALPDVSSVSAPADPTSVSSFMNLTPASLYPSHNARYCQSKGQCWDPILYSASRTTTDLARSVAVKAVAASWTALNSAVLDRVRSSKVLWAFPCSGSLAHGRRAFALWLPRTGRRLWAGAFGRMGYTA